MARFSLRKRKAKTCSLSVPSHRLSPSAYCQRRPPLPYLWPSPTSFMSTGLAISGGILCLSRRMVKAVLYSSCFSPVRVAESNRFPVTESEKILDGLLGRGFGAKCKSLIKLTKSRIDVIRRKRNATQKFLKKDIADLLANGLDINAYERQEVAHKYEAREDAPPKPVRLGSSSQGKGMERHDEAENFVSKQDGPDIRPHVKPNVAGPPVRIDGKDSIAGKEEGTPKLKPFSNYGLPPPYVKSSVKAKDRKHEASLGHDSSQGTGISTDPAA